MSRETKVVNAEGGIANPLSTETLLIRILKTLALFLSWSCLVSSNHCC